ncbi:MAG: type IV pilus twitching motility protein PilT [Pirellulales bacterium]
MTATAGSSAQSQQIEKLLKLAFDNGATEIRLSGNAAPMLRIDGQLRPLKSKPLTADDVAGLAAAIMPPGCDPAKFVFAAPLGDCVAALLDVQGTKVLILSPAQEAASAAAADMPLELDVQREAPSAAEAGGASDDVYAMPQAAVGTIQIDKLLNAAVKNGVSDIHITAGLPPVFRVDGHMKPQPTKVLTPDDTNGLMKSITPERCQAELAEKGGCDFGFAFKDLARFRVSVFKQRGSVAMVLRQIPNKLLTPEQLGVPEICKKLATRPRGLFLVTGPTGSGKSTTLASLIDFINKNYDHHIITIEDPIEFYHYSQKSTVNQREVGTDVPSFSEALRRALRQDPDVILVGELRDLETIEAAISAAETGHVVFGTLHTTGAQGTVNRIIDAFPTNQQEQVRTQLSTAILGVVSQTLLPKIGGGRCAAYEVLVVTPAIGNLIRENKTFRINSAIQTGAKLGMKLLDDDLFRLWNEKKVTEEDVLAKAQNVDELAKRITNAKQGIFDDEETVTRRSGKDGEK